MFSAVSCCYRWWVVRTGRPKAALTLSDEERDRLAGWARGDSRLSERARIVLACAEPGAVSKQVAADLGVTAVTVGKWRRRFVESRLDGLTDSPRPGRSKAGLVLTEEERATLQRWVRRPKTVQALAFRARIVLACAEGVSNKQVAAVLRTREQTVARWRGRFVRDRLRGLVDEPRPGAPRTITRFGLPALRSGQWPYLADHSHIDKFLLDDFEQRLTRAWRG
ncbi:helix-turn-helix domain-containing protein [Nocardia amamiensis]|uniref:helix-turn-helix domain-containing protein n=1 Tax=Nocardia amamiensis TaxID=404578 RepID=UPI0027D85211|nr:helix-turn-helix domain-containing protein [Nocardia amamiensis]